MWRKVSAVGFMVGLVVAVAAPACGGNGASVGLYGPDGSTIDSSPGDTGLHILLDSGTKRDSSTTTPTYDTGPAPSQDVYQPVPDTGTPDTSTPVDTGSGDGNTCVAACHVDSDCQNSCAAAASGSSNCCDTVSSSCFVSLTATCPSVTPTKDSGPDVY